MPLPIIVPLALAAASMIQGGVQASKAAKAKKKAKKDFDRSMADRPTYSESESSRQALAEAQSRKNAVSPGVIMSYLQAQQQAANQQAAIDRNAMSGAEALSAGSALNAAANRVLPQLAANQDQYQRANQADYYRALEGRGRQEELVQEDKMARSADNANYALGMAQAEEASRQAGVNNLISGAISAASTAYGASNPSFRGRTISKESIASMPTTQTSATPLATTRPQIQPRVPAGRYDPVTGKFIPALRINPYGIYQRR